MTEIQITEITSATPDALAAVNRLLPQLSSHAKELTVAELQAIVTRSHLFLLTAEDSIAGMLTLASYPCPTGQKWWIEDVVVDTACRGRRLGHRLMEHAIGYAKAHGGGTLMLTSRPTRTEANTLYRNMGFQPKETNVYTFNT